MSAASDTSPDIRLLHRADIAVIVEETDGGRGSFENPPRSHTKGHEDKGKPSCPFV
jgi:hypothetical protein